MVAEGMLEAGAGKDKVAAVEATMESAVVVVVAGDIAAEEALEEMGMARSAQAAIQVDREAGPVWR